MKETMLIVDDSRLQRIIFRDIIKDSFNILEAEDGEECLELVEKYKDEIDVILLDLMMPGMDGFEVLRRRKELDYFRDIPVIVLTASNTMQDQVRTFELGANEFIAKPVVPDIANSRINNLLESRRRMQRIRKESDALKEKAQIDGMTGLYNKVTTEEMIGNILKDKNDEWHALMIIDIDNFKSVNDLQGHQMGDHTIRVIANVISAQFRQTDIVGRVGGDEFVALMTGITSEKSARQKAKDIVRIMKRKENLSIPEYVTVSIGMVVSNGTIVSYEELLSKADEALYYSKKNGKGRMTQYGRIDENIRWEEGQAVLLCSKSRNVCSTIESMIEEKIQFVEIFDISEMEAAIQGKEDQFTVVYIDVSEEEDNGVSMWEQVKEKTKDMDISVVAICKEGNLAQYKEAIIHGEVQDILTKPLELEQLRRRMVSHLNTKQIKG